jgi:hypothetical protein
LNAVVIAMPSICVRSTAQAWNNTERTWNRIAVLSRLRRFALPESPSWRASGASNWSSSQWQSASSFGVGLAPFDGLRRREQMF